MAAYGPKYSFDFETTNGTGIQILILEKDRSGLPVTRSLGRAPLLKREKSGCMHGTSIEIHAECKVDREFAQLYTSSADQFKVEVWKKPASGPIIRAKIWEGFVSPELYSEPDIAPPYDVQIIATDGLGELKNYRFEAAGRKTVMEHVRSLLSHTGLDITVDVVSSLQYDSQGGFMNAVVSLDHMQGESCYDVLKNLLDSFHASITLQDGMWKVWRETDLATLSGQVEVAEFGSISSADWWPVGQLSTVIIPAEKEVTLVSENAYKDNVLKDKAWQVTGDAAFNEDEQAYVLATTSQMVSKYISFGAEVGYKLTLAVRARNVGDGEEDKPLGIKVEIDGRSYAAGDKFWLLEKTDGNYAWSNEEGAIEKLLGTPSQADTAADAKVITVELPLYSYDSRAYHYATAVKVTLFNPDGTYPVHVYDIALVKTQQAKGYKSVVQIANGARESAEETTLILADSDRIPAAAEVFMDGIPLNADGAPVSKWSSARVGSHGYLSFMSRDYALSHALPRMKVVGVLNVPASALITPMLYRRDNTYYFPETYDYDLLNDEISVNLVSIPTATISVSSEEVTEIVQEGTSIGITSGAGGGGTGGSVDLTGYATEIWVQEWVNEQGYLKGVEGSAFISVSQEDNIISLDVDPQGGLGATQQGLGIVDIPYDALEGNLKTINGQSIVGKGNIIIEGGSGGEGIVIDGEMSDTSENAVQNKVIKAYADLHPKYEVIEEIVPPEGGGSVSIVMDTEMSDDSENAVQNKVIKKYVDDSIANIDIDTSNLINVTYEELLEKSLTGKLTVGTKYRIIDYYTTVEQEGVMAETGQFDIVVVADTEYYVNEEVHAVDAYKQLQGYYAIGGAMYAWRIRYTLVPFYPTRFEWACFGDEYMVVAPELNVEVPFTRISPTYTEEVNGEQMYCLFSASVGLPMLAYCRNADPQVGDMLLIEGNEFPISSIVPHERGKGVIYDMTDEWGNSAPYDFKNIKFRAYGSNVSGYTFEPRDGAYERWVHTFEGDDMMDATEIGNVDVTVPSGDFFIRMRFAVYNNKIKYFPVRLKPIVVHGDRLSYSDATTMFIDTQIHDNEFINCDRLSAFVNSNSVLRNCENVTIRYNGETFNNNIHIDCLKGEEGNPIVIENLVTSEEYTTHIGKNSQGEVKIWNPADLV